MTIETKYNIGEEVWFMRRKAHKQIIEGVRTTKQMVSPFLMKPYLAVFVEYLVGENWEHEKDLFPTKEELLKSL